MMSAIFFLLIFFFGLAGVSGTSAIMVPGSRRSPFFTTMWVSHFFEVSRLSTLIPRLM